MHKDLSLTQPRIKVTQRPSGHLLFWCHMGRNSPSLFLSKVNQFGQQLLPLHILAFSLALPSL